MPKQRTAFATVIADAFSDGSDKTFEKTMKKTSLCTLGIPAQFYQDNSTDIGAEVGISYEGGTLRWNVTVTSTLINQKRHVVFGSGWHKFAVFHNICYGNRIKFTLVGKSLFIVQHAPTQDTSAGTSAAHEAISSDEDYD